MNTICNQSKYSFFTDVSLVELSNSSCQNLPDLYASMETHSISGASTSYASTSYDMERIAENYAFENEDIIKDEVDYMDYDILNYDNKIITIDDDPTPNENLASFSPHQLSPISALRRECSTPLPPMQLSSTETSAVSGTDSKPFSSLRAAPDVPLSSSVTRQVPSTVRTDSGPFSLLRAAPSVPSPSSVTRQECPAQLSPLQALSPGYQSSPASFLLNSTSRSEPWAFHATSQEFSTHSLLTDIHRILLLVLSHYL